MTRDDSNSYPYYFWALYALTYMTNAVYNTFMPVYLNHIGYSQAAVGVLLALGPLIASFTNPIWGIAGDRASSKNLTLKMMLLGSAALILVLPLSNNFYFLFAAISIFTCFVSSINPMCDAIALEQLEARRIRFGPVRMAGTVGFAAMSVTAGIVAKQNIHNIFPLYFCLAILGFLSVFRVPAVKGHQSKGNRVSPWLLLKNRELMLLIVLNFIIQVTFGFYYSFFPIYFKQLGAGSSLLGWAMLITSLSEIPFLLNADRFIERFGVKAALLLSTMVISLRWGLVHFITDEKAVLAIGAMHGFSFIVFNFCMATYINKNVPKELRATGQTLNALLCMGIARTIGSAAGGVISGIVGINQVFLYTSLTGFATLFVFGFIFRSELFRLKGTPNYLKS